MVRKKDEETPESGARRSAKASAASKGKATRGTTSRKRMGRPSVYSEALGTEICERIAAGESLRGVCEDPRMPARLTVIRWLIAGEPEDFCNRYAHARQVQAELFADDMVAVAAGAERSVVTDHNGVTRVDAGAVQARKLLVEQMRWNAERLLPKKYGTLLKHSDHTGEAPAAFHVHLPQQDS